MIGFPILREGIYPKGAFREVEMQNWVASLGLEGDASVRHTPLHWIVHVKVLRGQSEKELYNKAVALACQVASSLCSKYGCQLGAPSVMRFEIVVDDPVARFFGQYFTVRSDNRKIDHSWGVGELEHTTTQAVVDYMQMPEHVKAIKEKQKIIIEHQSAI